MTELLQPMVEDWSRALAVVAHPDDVEFGAAGAVAAWTAAGKSVAYLLLTRGEAGIDGLEPARCAEVREAEQRTSAKIVGVDEVEFGDHADGVIEYGVPLRRDIAAAIRRHRPELVIGFNHHDTFPGGKRNSPDHRHVGQALLDAVGDAGNRWIFPELLEQGLLPWGGVRWTAVAGSPYPTHAEAVTGDALQRAVASLTEHRAYIVGLGEEDPHEYARKLTEEMLTEGGKQCGADLAVAFELVPHSFED